MDSNSVAVATIAVAAVAVLVLIIVFMAADSSRSSGWYPGHRYPDHGSSYRWGPYYQHGGQDHRYRTNSLLY